MAGNEFKINKRIVHGKKSNSVNGFNKSRSSKAIQDLPNHTDYTNVLEQLQSSNQDVSIKEYYAHTAYSSVYSKVSRRLKEVIESVDSIRYFYLVDVMLNQIAEDALAPKIGDESILNFSCEDKEIQSELDDLKKRIDLDQLIENITPDLLAYGEYTLKTKIGKPNEVKDDELNGKKKKFRKKTMGKGLTDVTDIVDQGTVIALTQDGKTEGYLSYSEHESKIQINEVADYIKFSMGGQRIKIDINEMIPVNSIKNPLIREAVEKIPRFIRVGRSQLYSLIPKIRDLEMLEKLVPATKINKLAQGNLIGMNLPENYQLEEGLKAVRRIEGMVNKKVSIDPNSRELTVESILSTAGKTKVIPLFGEKGRLEQMDFRDSEPDDLLTASKEIRETILDSVGIPSELVFKSDSDNRAEVIKRYAKYLRKLKNLQKTIANGCKQMAYIHLSNKGISFTEDQISIKFNNSLVEIDNLDKLEHADVTLSLLGNVRDFFNDMVEEHSPYRDMVNLDKVAKYLEENLRTISLADAITTSEEGGVKADPTAVDVDGVDSDGNPTRDDADVLDDEEDEEEGDGAEFEKQEEGE